MADRHLKILETERLTLSRLTPGDKHFILRLLNEDSWKRFIGDKQIETLADAERYILNVPTKMYEKHGFSLLLVRLKESNGCLGLCGLIKRDGLEAVDLGFAFLPEYSGMGYAQESALAVMQYGKIEHGLDSLSAITLSNNIRSKVLLKRLGFQFVKWIQMEGDEEELELHEISMGLHT